MNTQSINDAMNSEFNTSSRIDEYFPYEKEPEKKKKESKKKSVAKALAVTTSVVVSTVVISVVTTTPLVPLKMETKIFEYYLTEQETNPYDSYMIEISFNTKGVIVDSISLKGSEKLNPLIDSFFDIPPEDKIIDETIYVSDLILDENTAKAYYFVENSIMTLEVTPTLNYHLEGKENEPLSIEGDLFLFEPSFMYEKFDEETYESLSNNTIEYIENGDLLDVIYTINDFYQGSLDFYIDDIYLLINDEIIEPQNLNLPYEITAELNQFKFSIPKQKSGFNINLSLGGSCYIGDLRTSINSYIYYQTTNPQYQESKISSFNLTDFTETNYDSYDVEFEFYTFGKTVESITLIGSETYNPIISGGFLDIPIGEEKDINITISNDQLNFEGYNVIANYTVENAYATLEITPYLNYYDENDNLLTISGETFIQEPTFMYSKFDPDTNELITENTLSYVESIDLFDFTFTINDFYQGSYEFYIEEMYIYVNDVETSPTNINLPIQINKDSNQLFFSLPKQEDSFTISVDIIGHCYFNHTKTNISSYTSFYKTMEQIIT